MLVRSAPMLRRVAEIEASVPDWVWAGRIPIGALTVLEGDPGLGKSTPPCDIAARASTGTTMPSDDRTAEPASVLLFAGEDQLGSVVRPRL